MGAYLHCFGGIHVKNVSILITLFSLIITIVATFIVSVLLIKVQDGVPSLIQFTELNSSTQYAFWLIYESISVYALAFFYLEQIVQIFVSVLLFLGIYTRTSVLFRPYICFNVFYIIASYIEIAMSIYGILTIKDHLNLDKQMEISTTRVLTQFALVKLFLVLFNYYCIWIAIRLKALVEGR